MENFKCMQKETKYCIELLGTHHPVPAIQLKANLVSSALLPPSPSPIIMKQTHTHGISSINTSVSISETWLFFPLKKRFYF